MDEPAGRIAWREEAPPIRFLTSAQGLLALLLSEFITTEVNWINPDWIGLDSTSRLEQLLPPAERREALRAGASLPAAGAGSAPGLLII